MPTVLPKLAAQNSDTPGQAKNQKVTFVTGQAKEMPNLKRRSTLSPSPLEQQVRSWEDRSLHAGQSHSDVGAAGWQWSLRQMARLCSSKASSIASIHPALFAALASPPRAGADSETWLGDAWLPRRSRREGSSLASGNMEACSRLPAPLSLLLISESL